MNRLAPLLDCAGLWQGTNTLHNPMTGSPEDSPSTATITPVLSDEFIRFDYTWRYEGNPQEGSMVIGHEMDENVITAYWIDSWHMADKGMLCRGEASTTEATSNELSVRGSYGAGEGPDWGWRIVLAPNGDEALRLIMYNIDPDGQEHLAVEAQYTRA